MRQKCPIKLGTGPGSRQTRLCKPWCLGCRGRRMPGVRCALAWSNRSRQFGCGGRTVSSRAWN